MTNILILNDGQTVTIVDELDYSALIAKLQNERTFAIKIGKKVLQRNMVAAIVPVTAIEQGEHNVQVTVNNHVAYTTIAEDKIDVTLEQVETDLNGKSFIQFNDLIIARGFYQVSEVI